MSNILTAEQFAPDGFSPTAPRLPTPHMNEQGVGLLEVVIMMGLMGVLMAAFSAMTTYQVNETTALSQKLASLDLERLLISTLADGSVCTYQLTNPIRTFDAVGIGTAHPPVIPWGAAILAKGQAGAPAVATVGQPGSAYSNTVVVNSLQVEVVAGDPAGSQFVADIKVGFDPASLKRPIKPLAVRTTLNTTGAGTVKTITSCSGAGGGGGPTLAQMCAAVGGVWDAAASPPCRTITCNGQPPPGPSYTCQNYCYNGVAVPPASLMVCTAEGWVCSPYSCFGN